MRYLLNVQQVPHFKVMMLLITLIIKKQYCLLTLKNEGVNIAKVLLLNRILWRMLFMSYEKVLQAKSFIVGTKQTVKALKLGVVKEVVVAKDAEAKVTAKVEDTAIEFNVPVTYVDSMKKLGKSCGIEVGAATVAITI